MTPVDVALCAYQLARSTGSAEAFEAAAHAMARAIAAERTPVSGIAPQRPVGRPMLIVDNTSVRAA